MTTRMLIDARHREETRVAVVKGNRIEEFDFESAEHKQIKGNIYLAKVTRVEPSLQAAFVEYGGNRHGFLAFSEIHPDYYQIPKEDRDALLREQAELAAADAAYRAEEDLDALEGEIEDVLPPTRFDDEDGDHHDDDDYGDDAHDDARDDAREDTHGGQHDEYADDADDDGERSDERHADDEGSETNGEARGRGRSGNDRGNNDRGRGRGRQRGGRSRSGSDERDENAEKRQNLRHRYKIQDVIRRRQVLLVQVVKEERGNKGAALTSYLSLAGRYCVLMPNSSHGGGISRKISNGADRKRLKSVIDDLGLPATMGCIVRTAGLERTKVEIKRDFDYLARLWDEIREGTLKSEAPALIHSDSDLIKRAIRDIYNSDIEEVAVEGEDGYRAAKDFMKLLMPSHARRVKQYVDPVSLFQRYGAEDQLAAMYQPLVQLKSGGYLVINPTEALVSIDINSGRSTREHSIEQTAVNTNLEAAYEIARQLRLRDMAGLVVIDFIDMDHSNNVRKVERAMRDALKNDRARIQVGRISGFGLMEMSRQRLRTGVLEASTRACPHCEGTGLVRTASSAGLSALRLLEEEAARGRGTRLTLRASQEAAFYVLNNKRHELGEIEERYGVIIDVQGDGQTEGARMAVEASGPPPANRPRFVPINEPDEDEDDTSYDHLDEDEDEDESVRQSSDRGDRGGRDGQREGQRERGEGDGEGGRKRRGRRRRGGRSDERDGERSDERGGERSDERGGERSDERSAQHEGDRDNRPVRANGDDDAPRGEGDDGAREAGDDARRDDAGRNDAPRDGDHAAEGEAPKRRRGRRGGRNRRPNGAEIGSDGGESDGRSGNNGDARGYADDAEAADADARADTDASGNTATRSPTPTATGFYGDGPAAEPASAADVAVEAPARRGRRKAAPLIADAAADEAPPAADAPAAPAKRGRRKAVAAQAEAAPETVAEIAEVADAEAPAKPKRASRAKKPAADAAAELAPDAGAVDDAADARAAADLVADGDGGDGGDRRRGWWQRTFGA